MLNPCWYLESYGLDLSELGVPCGASAAESGAAYAGAQGVATTQLVSSAHEVAVSQGLVPGGPSLAR